jgi:hypothetical protein
MDLVAASWADRYSNCLLAFVDGGRPVVVLRTPAGRWAACNAFLGSLYATAHEADQHLEKLRKPRREAYVVSLQRGHIHTATPGNLLANWPLATLMKKYQCDAKPRNAGLQPPTAKKRRLRSESWRRRATPECLLSSP